MGVADHHSSLAPVGRDTSSIRPERFSPEWGCVNAVNAPDPRRAGRELRVRGAGGIPAEPGGWLPAPLLPDAGISTAAAPAAPMLVASLSGPLLLHQGCP